MMMGERNQIEGYFQRGSDNMQLNYDILLNTMPFLVNKRKPWYMQYDLCALMHTCRTLYNHGMPIYLGGEISVVLLSRYLSHFCNFILGDPKVRPSHLRHLHLEGNFSPIERIPPFMLGLKGELAQIIQNAHNLKTLRISSIEALLLSDDRFLPALLSLSKLDSLIFVGIAERTCRELLPGIQSPITSIETRPGLSCVATYDPVLALANFTESLAVMRAYWLRFDSRAFQYHKLHTLVVEIPSLDSTVDALGVMVHCFPNLQCLSLTVHRLNLSPGAELQGPHPALRNGWRQLKKLICRTRIAAALHLNQKVKLWRGARLHYRREVEPFHTVLGAIQPSHLDMSICASSITTRLDIPWFPPIPVTHLKICMDLSDLIVSQVPVIMGRLATFISSLQLTFLDLFVANYGTSGTDDVSESESETQWADSAPHPEARSVFGMDDDAFVLCLVNNAPNLKHSLVRFWRPPAVFLWEVTRVRSVPTVRRFPAHERQDLIAEYESEFDTGT